MDDYDLEQDFVDLADDDYEFETESADDYEDPEIEAMMDDSEFELDDDEDDEIDEDADVDETLAALVNADSLDDEEHADLVLPWVIKAAMNRKKKKRKSNERKRQRYLKKLAQRRRASKGWSLSNRRSIAALRRQVAINKGNIAINARKGKSLTGAVAANSRRISKASSAASRANTVNKVQSRQIARTRKIMRTDGALDFARSITLERTPQGIDINIDVTSALQGAVKQEWLGRGRGFLNSPAALGVIGFAANNLAAILPNAGGNAGLVQVNP